MSARIGADDVSWFDSPHPDLLREITGIEPEPAGVHVLLDKHLGVQSTQRLAIGDVGGNVIVALWPAEMKSQAEYLYESGRAQAMLSAARDCGWDAEPSPHLAFFNSRPSQRLYMSPDITAEEYARRWSASDAHMIGRHPTEAAREALWPWLKERGYVDDRDDDVFERFALMLGSRRVDLRPGLRLKRRWQELETSERQLAAAIRNDVNAILRAAGEPSLPAVPSRSY